MPKHPSARVRRERREGDKRVTIVSGLDAHATDLPALLKKFKAQFGAGRTINDGRIELQGDHRGKLVTIISGLDAHATDLPARMNTTMKVLTVLDSSWRLRSRPSRQQIAHKN